jgi:hypothetical protein
MKSGTNNYFSIDGGRAYVFFDDRDEASVGQALADARAQAKTSRWFAAWKPATRLIGLVSSFIGLTSFSSSPPPVAPIVS